MPNLAVPTEEGAFFDLKFHQVAIYIQHDLMWKAIGEWIDMGYGDWSYDIADLNGVEYGELSSKHAKMAFNYGILPLEFEYVTYLGEAGPNPGRNSHDRRSGNPPFISHMSTYVENLEEEQERLLQAYGLSPYHTFETSNHTNPNVAGIKRFGEAIYDTNMLLGFDLKLIQRLPWAEAHA